ncbi:MAG: conserved hypothetical protein, membrane [Candidatus Syntrophoarchaeum caldarius]|uniref:DUF7847 domain-containing protein n=1 Tax=Candidatus Syntropharchaeum caldarium TaxID=1838285 RepID=A0A1F2PCB1_9EURY|nr:MAG: conserved hypothetical protein, membrane [Candidatus Syntrophoarchaeum caldarius]
MTDLGRILGDGFETWKQNLNLAVPFILEQILIWVMLVIAILVAFFTAFASIIPYLEKLGPEPAPEALFELWTVVAPFIGIFLIGVLIISILLMLVDAFIWAGAVGMAKLAIETGECRIGDMFDYGKKHFLAVFISNILVGIAFLLGFLALVPGVVVMATSVVGVMLLVLGALIMILYQIFVALSFYLARFAIVVDGVGAIEGMKRSYRVFKSNKLDMLLLGVILFAAVFVVEISYVIILMLASVIPVIGGALQMILQIAFSLIVIPMLIALMVVWLTEFYIDRSAHLHSPETMITGDI